jgi:leucyl aminopeptidase
VSERRKQSPKNNENIKKELCVLTPVSVGLLVEHQHGVFHLKRHTNTKHTQKAKREREKVIKMPLAMSYKKRNNFFLSSFQVE